MNCYDCGRDMTQREVIFKASPEHTLCCDCRENDARMTKVRHMCMGYQLNLSALIEAKQAITAGYYNEGIN